MKVRQSVVLAQNWGAHVRLECSPVAFGSVISVVRGHGGGSLQSEPRRRNLGHPDANVIYWLIQTTGLRRQVSGLRSRVEALGVDVRGPLLKSLKL